ncbi:hypothetical protein PGT21_011526 [Puccinia graminis f. sp. tritici]|uniref:Uncharacterized protein n=2 Tax=Puccinia graminis f. sp. tritici TaxID=56615 RepID=E3KS39_PUCGT|nr:uncharacterized protein PGTG_13333 [Puccinia graminis f. sp. tritici CRL 75-36-700-3]EFP87114.2 hypothetical protein PGTG_13333 [Puccinia graminis f. sp. tritici CRL 75-36-700-3]KAA1073420.1 hypothetical protein PGT21_011526 [Puccinia graminis f. sp. tritici]KAA1122015.1 hypothetical protein PGTUg99_018452 [Puccinia graminis f. sp. tritici]
MQLLQSLLVSAAILVGNIHSQSDGSFSCDHQIIDGKPATVAFCGHPNFNDHRKPKTPTSFSKFQPANPVGRSPVDHYTCVGIAPLLAYCCIPDTMGDVSDKSS